MLVLANTGSAAPVTVRAEVGQTRRGAQLTSGFGTEPDDGLTLRVVLATSHYEVGTSGYYETYQPDAQAR